MTAKILPLPGIQAPTQPIAHYLRIGHTGYRELESLLENGRLLARRVVVSASKLKFQNELVSALKTAGTEIILDTDAAELSALARCDGTVRTAPWASIGDGSPLLPEHFAAGAKGDVIGQIARFAVEHKFDAVLAPGHFIRNGNQDDWFDVDRNACAALRKALDREGGGRIGIDYALILTYTHLHDEAIRGALLPGLQDLPFDNLWIRASGFGSDATPMGAKRYITALTGFHNLGKPVIADYVGGLIGLAAVAFGASSGIAHGVGEYERFNAGQWDKPRQKKEDGGGGGRTIRVVIPGLDKSVTRKELEILANARGGHRLVVCGERECCLHGREDMTKNWRAHFQNQRFRQTRSLELVPDLRRIRHFLDTYMAEADRLARQVKNLKIDDKNLTLRLEKHSHLVEMRRTVLENLQEIRGDSPPRAPAAVRRGVETAGDRKGGV